MNRLFGDHILRPIQSLDGAWEFRTDPADAGEAEKWFCGLEKTRTVAVPSVWNTQLGLLEYEGVAWYEKKFYTGGGCLRFCFEAVLTEAKVWLDGKFLGSHYGGFCQFELLADEVEAGFHTLTLRVDNRFDAQSIPQAKVDWYHYGGITRSVSVEQLSGICVLNNRMEYQLSDDLGSAKCHFVLDLYNAQKANCSSPVSVHLDNKQVYADTVTMDAGESRCIRTPDFTVDNVRLWDVFQPELYEIHCATDTDDLIDRTGFRKVEIADGKLLLNKKPLEIRGVNRHEEHPDWGLAFPHGLMQRDIDIVLNMGCNSLRGSHYPNSHIFVDMLDSQGITFWSELPFWGWGFSVDALADPVVVGRGMEMLRDMVKYYYNHPCILLWGMHNELRDDTQPAYAMSEKYFAYLKECGGNRLITYATDKPLTDICLEFCDIISLNRYTGWYYGTREGWQDEIDSFRERREALGLAHKPVIYSEFGGAAIYGHHTFDDLLGTEEYQAELMRQSLNTFHKDPMVVGFYIWQFCDTRTCRQMGLDRARSYNNKGILNEYRKPKLAYYAVQEAYRSFAAEE